MATIPTAGRFITLEGGEGAGKSTLAKALAARLSETGLTVDLTREPGGSPKAERMREALLGGRIKPYGAFAEALMFSAARIDHIDQRIRPALARGDWVICDRFSDATYAYQGGGRGLDKARLGELERWVHGHLQPDLTFLFDLSPCVAGERIAVQRRDLDRFEQERAEFHARVRQAYLERAAQAPQRIVVIDADRPATQIWNEIEATLLRHGV